MITHLQKTWKIQNKVTHSASNNYFLNQIKIFSWSFNIKLSKVSRNIQKKQDTVDLKSTMNPFNIIKIHTIFIQQ